MRVVEVYADVACPFTYVGMHRFEVYRQQAARSEPILRVRAWPLELVNGTALDGQSVIPKIEALRSGVAPDLFAGFDADRFPTSTLPAMAAEAAAYRQDLQVGAQFSLAVRQALFEDGLDVADHDVLQDLCRRHGVPLPGSDMSAVLSDFTEGKRRGVVGSPHFFTTDGDFFCPSLEISHDDDGYRVCFDHVGFQRFIEAAFN